MRAKAQFQAIFLVQLFLISAALVACGNHQQPATEQPAPAANQPVTYPKDTFTPGVVIPHVELRLDNSQSYALYLPKGYTDSSKLPVILFFDPHGEGSKPDSVYSKLADKYHFILMGSNNSKNLIDFGQTTVFANNMLNEAISRYSVDQTKITMAGFSGGAKVAMNTGAMNPIIGTIIYAGADAEITPNHPVTLLGFAGKMDMNYTDLVQYDWDLKKTTIPHYLIEWKGKHEWPTADVYEDAFKFLTTGKIDNYDKKQATISSEKVEQELTIKKKYIHAFQQKESLDWWKKEVADLNAKSKTDPMYARMLGFISLACYSFSNQDLMQNNIDEMGRILEIYKIADPGNKDCDTLYQVYLRRKAGQ